MPRATRPSVGGVHVVFEERDWNGFRFERFAEVHFEVGPLAGLRLTDFEIDGHVAGIIWVALPAHRRFTEPGSQREMLGPAFIRSATNDPAPERRLQDWIEREYRQLVREREAATTRKPHAARARVVRRAAAAGTGAVHVVFVAPRVRRAWLKAEVEIHFDDGPLVGLKLAGLTLWRDHERGTLYAHMPTRLVGLKPEQRFHDFISSATDDPTPVHRLRAWIVAEYERQVAERGSAAVPKPLPRRQRRTAR